MAAADHYVIDRLSIADASIYATARFHNAELITSDAHFVALPVMRFLRRKAKKRCNEDIQDRRQEGE